MEMIGGLPFFYHLTRASFEASIRKKGLEGSIDDIFVDDGDMRLAVNLAATLEPRYREPEPGKDIICVIDESKLDPLKLVNLDGWWWRYLDSIPPEAIIEYRRV